MENTSRNPQNDGLSDRQAKELLATFRRDLPFASAEAFARLQAAYTPLLRAEVDSFRQDPAMAEIDREDLLQEASIVLLRAARRFDLEQDKVTFGLYLTSCLRNALVSQLRRARRREVKNAKLRRGVSPKDATVPGIPDVGSSGNAPSALSGVDALTTGRSRWRTKESTALRRVAKLFLPLQLPPKTASDGENALPEASPANYPRTPSLQMLREELPPLLTPYENEVFRRFYAGMSYEEIADELSRDLKSVDNALYRIRKKWRAHFWETGADD